MHGLKGNRQKLTKMPGNREQRRKLNTQIKELMAVSSAAAACLGSSLDAPQQPALHPAPPPPLDTRVLIPLQ